METGTSEPQTVISYLAGLQLRLFGIGLIFRARHPLPCGPADSAAMFTCCAAEPETVFEEVTPIPVSAEPAEKKDPPAVLTDPLATPRQPIVETPATEGVVFTFQLPDNTSREVTFKSKPLGLDFSKAVPMTVKAVKKDSFADQLQIQPKWIITHVQRKPLPQELKDAMKTILQEVKDLPQQ
eukprot:s333_g12.t2